MAGLDDIQVLCAAGVRHQMRWTLEAFAFLPNQAVDINGLLKEAQTTLTHSPFIICFADFSCKYAVRRYSNSFEKLTLVASFENGISDWQFSMLATMSANECR